MSASTSASTQPPQLKLRRTWLYYLGLLLVSALALLLLSRYAPAPAAADLSAAAPVATTTINTTHTGAGFVPALLERLTSPLVLLLLQMVVVISTAKLLGRVLALCHQPAVIGEMLAGIVLGPSLFGDLSPGAAQWLFPPGSLAPLQLLSQLGVLLFLFGIGAELNIERLRQHGLRILVISHTSIVLPFLLGAGSAYLLYETYAPAGVSFLTFALFMGIAMSITAFPVLVRILRERGLASTSLGHTAIACAAIGDVTAWCLLAAIVAIGQSASATTALPVALLGLAWCALLWWGLRPRLHHFKLEKRSQHSAMVAVLVLALASAAVTELIGIHALFGAFLAGTVVAAHSDLRKLVLERIEPVAGALLLPLFFASTGLKTQVNLLAGSDWLVCAALVLLATVGKWGGTALTARYLGSRWREAVALGLLMNTRGLMELIVLNIGYDLGFLSERIFTMLVLMALLTTVLTGPALRYLQQRYPLH